MRKSTESYLRDLEKKLCGKLVSSQEQDNIFESSKERQAYNRGIGDAMGLVREMLESDDFRSSLAKSLE